jgi:Protein of unknown function (DUF2877)
MMVPAAYSTAVRPVLTGPIQPASWLGASASALYLITGSATVLAIVTHDAARLPCALVLASTAAELPLTRLAPAPGRRPFSPAAVGAGRVEWSGPAGVVTIAGAREWAPARASAGTPARVVAGALDALSSAVAGHDIGLERERVALLRDTAGDPAAQFAAVAALLGRGPGLTPSGDDVIAGFLLGARAFGRAVPGALAAVTELAGDATTALSAQLLRHAARGDCIAELAAVLAALTGRPAPPGAVGSLLAVGQSSGAGLAVGLVSAAACPRAPITVAGAS